ncbi:MAG: hypothetical protein HN411_01950 [Waddliaceae bacterium]|jgi:hypothetical protein|nr:hypothetical protein [Waddliaceae bacterium]MBT3579127.1 hypothetical protein [Waddliaceae bacterium]MBT6927927.1 hypothetical protein [Waddliaceae bacterium]MBT7264793.1 hypothetical protein [Waddliaceae bacterium]MBT7462084.1 hypothetical protein [Waddliaceae bacterium]
MPPIESPPTASFTDYFEKVEPAFVIPAPAPGERHSVKEIVGFYEDAECRFSEGCSWAYPEAIPSGYGYNVDLPEEIYKETLKAFVDSFPLLYKPEKEYGPVVRHSIASETYLHVRADIHGALKSVIEDLNFLKYMGCLDENYKVLRDHNGTPKVKFIFLGDFIDRGFNSTGVLYLLATLKLENPSDVVLVRGNHDRLCYHDGSCYIDRSFPPETLREEFFARMPLAAYTCHEIPPEGKPKQYVQHSHGCFDVHTVDIVANFLRSDADSAALPLYNPDKAIPMIASLLPKKGKNIIQVNGDGRLSIDILRRFIFSRDSEMTPYIREILDISDGVSISDTALRKRAKLTYAAIRINVYGKKIILDELRPANTMFTWGRVYDRPCRSLSYGEYSPEIIQCWLWLIGAKAAVRGHDHYHQIHPLNIGSTEKQGLIHTLPISGELYSHTIHHGNYDTRYLLTTSSKVKHWTVHVISRRSKRSDDEAPHKTIISGPKRFYGVVKPDDSASETDSDAGYVTAEDSGL